MAKSTLFSVEVAARDFPIWSGNARLVTVPCIDGAATFLPDHAPYMTLLKAGVLRIRTEEGKDLVFNIDQGFAAFERNELMIAVAGTTDKKEGEPQNEKSSGEGKK